MSKASAELTALASRILTDRRFCSDENHRNLAAGCLALSEEIDRLKEELKVANHACFLSIAENKSLRGQLNSVLDANEKLSQYPAPLRAFAIELVDASYEGGSFDGCDIQDIAVRHGLLRIERRDKECGEACACREYGFPVDCYRKTALLDQRDSQNLTHQAE
ncbi:hypothetical protein H7A76_06360 [Pseudomonas sp. MSSRFD41]|uniref:hypothetical protein n=1 Tax=Pseudomonas sp. MSSRFD41 TaxID=1310370 RepID=UPI00163976A3|nr:hypothetical protein [Pseudomonas sp. MSSRFD41]MBC2655058.1 hypothetical protein [Pseudomonas sp. MSSRFD41]